MVWLTKDAAWLTKGPVWFTKDDVVARVDSDRYELGLELYEQIGPLQVFADHVVALVGDDDHQVRLTGADGRLIGECSCPVGRSGGFCEHCVAAAVMAVDVTRPPDAAALLSRVDAVGGAWLSSQNLDRWAKEAEDLLLTLEEVTIDHPEITRPLYQRLLRELAHSRADFDSQEDRQVLLDMGEQTTAGLVRACLGEPLDPDELAGWIFDLELEETGHIFVEVADLVEALGAWGLAAFRRRLDEADRSLPAEDCYYDEFDDNYDEEAVNQRAAIAYVREHFLLAFEPDVEVLKAFYAENPASRRDRSIAEALRSAGRIDRAISWVEGMQRELWDEVMLAELYELRSRHRDAARIRWHIFERVPHQRHYRALLAAAEPLNAVEYAKNRAFSYLEGLQQNDDYDLAPGADLLAELYELRGRYRDAARIRWHIFEHVTEKRLYRDRELAYEALLAAAEPLNAVEYAKNRAFAHLRERAVRFGPNSDAAASLVHLLFAVGNVDRGWEAAREFDLDVRELPGMAWALAHQHPADAISIMLRAAELTIDRRSDYARFNRAAYLMTELKAMHQRAGLDFADCLERFKADYRHRRPLLTALANNGL